MARNHSLAWVLGLALILTGCATPLPQRLDGVVSGMDKTEVLDKAGSPKRTKRLNDGDLWTYIYYVGERPFEREIRFEAGHVVSISSAREVHTDPATGDLILQDYENLVNEAQQKAATPKDPKDRE